MVNMDLKKIALVGAGLVLAANVLGSRTQAIAPAALPNSPQVISNKNAAGAIVPPRTYAYTREGGYTGTPIGTYLEGRTTHLVEPAEYGWTKNTYTDQYGQVRTTYIYDWGTVYQMRTTAPTADPKSTTTTQAALSNVVNRTATDAYRALYGTGVSTSTQLKEAYSLIGRSYNTDGSSSASISRSTSSGLTPKTGYSVITRVDGSQEYVKG